MVKKIATVLLFAALVCPMPVRAADEMIIVDGTTYSKDDTGIQAAMAALPSSGGVIELMSGTYPIRKTISFSKNNVTIKGNGRVILRLENYVNSNIIYLSYFDNLTLTNLELDGNRKNQSGPGAGIKNGIRTDNLLIENCYVHGIRGPGIFLNGTRNVTIHNCRIEGTDDNGIQMHASIYYNILDTVISYPGKHGIFLSGGTDPFVNSHFMIRGNTIIGCQGEGNSSIHVWGSENGIITQNMIRDNANGVYGTNAIYLRSNNGSSPCNITVSENNMQNISGVFVELSTGGVMICGNTCKGSGGASNMHGNGIFIRSGVNNVIISNNLVSGANQHGIYCANSISNISICGNSISNSGQSKSGAIAGIRFMNTTGETSNIQVKDNRIYDDQEIKTQDHGIYASGAGNLQNVKVSGNIFSGNAISDLRGITEQ